MQKHGRAVAYAQLYRLLLSAFSSLVIFAGAEPSFEVDLLTCCIDSNNFCRPGSLLIEELPQ